tara:strand:- start:818 stop:1843 length:1026 start_codon:yes stop_codon:yes gene_type:complete
MASTYTPNLKIEKIGDGEQAGTWGNTTNQNLEAIEDAICGRITLGTSDFTSNVATLTLANSNATANARHLFIQVDATLSANATLNLPALEKTYIVFNNNPGDFHLQVKVSGQTGIQVPKGERGFVIGNGTDFIDSVTHLEHLGVNMRTSGLANDAKNDSNWGLYVQSNDEAPAIGAFGYKFSGSFPSPSIACYTNQTTSNNLIQFHYVSGASLSAVGTGTSVGNILTNGSSTTYSTSSDYRLKENIVPLENALNRVNLLSTYRFNFISTPSVTVDGFIAHEVADVVPESVTGYRDEVDARGNPVYQGIDQAKLVPILVKAVQELSSKVDALEARIETLESA